MGSWDRPAHAQLEHRASRLVAHGAADAVFRDQVFLCHATPADDDVYWLETVTPDGTVQDVAAGGDRESSGGNLAVADPVRPYPYRARGPASATGAWSSIPAASAFPAIRDNVPFPHVIEAGTPDARYAILELGDGKLARDLPPCALRSRCDGGAGAANGHAELHPRWRRMEREFVARMDAAQSGTCRKRSPGYAALTRATRSSPKTKRPAIRRPFQISNHRKPIRPQR